MVNVNLKERLQAIRNRVNATTPGDWVFWEYPDMPDKPHGVTVPLVGEHDHINATHFHRREDSLFTALARNDIQFLLDTVDLLMRRMDDIAGAAVEDTRSWHDDSQSTSSS